MPAMPHPPLCPQRVRAPSEQEARISQTRGAQLPVLATGDERGGSAAGGAAAASGLVHPHRGQLWGNSRALSPLGTPAARQGASSLLCRIIVLTITKQSQSPVSSYCEGSTERGAAAAGAACTGRSSEHTGTHHIPPKPGTVLKTV